MELSTKYEPSKIEKKWYKYWQKEGFSRSVPDSRPPYTIVIPPPNVTGVLHMGHMLNNTLQDILVRRARMLGFNACWVPGTDHASIATEAKVVGKLQAEGISKQSLSREEFLEHAWQWTEEHGGIILQQLRHLGASCDWERTCFTMDTIQSESVFKVFCDLYQKGFIYRGYRMVHWDPKAQTALSDEEVIYKEEHSKLYYVQYEVEGEEGAFATIATTRPETILGDTALCVHPEDERFRRLHGKRVIVPLVQRSVPVITDDYVDKEFGTGCLKITPAHDANDYEIGLRHQLGVIDIFNPDGTLNGVTGWFTGEDRVTVREKIIHELERCDALVKVEDYTHKVGYSERTDAVVEPRLSKQWFCRVKELSKPALKAVLEGRLKFYPEKFKNTYQHWMEGIRDWCISRQLWWGHRIPVWYFNGEEETEFIVAENEQEALAKARQIKGDPNLPLSSLSQDEDVLDTWFSSWLWPLSVFDGIRRPNNEEINYYYPTQDLVTAPEIIFFWVARMIMAGYEYKQEMPFQRVYFTGIVRDKLRRKMSKTLGNSPEPLELIEQFGADGVRVGMLLCSPAGNDLLFDNSLVEQGRNFSNKIWNAFRLVKSWKKKEDKQPTTATQAALWFGQKLSNTTGQINQRFEYYRLSEALMSTYSLFRDDFCGWYLEAIKPPFGEPIDSQTLSEAIAFFEELLKLLHPFMPFITEELWQNLVPRKEGETIMLQTWPTPSAHQKETLKRFEEIQEVIGVVRKIRKEKNLPFKEKLSLFVNTHGKPYSNTFDQLLQKLGNVTIHANVDRTLPNNTVQWLVNTEEYSLDIADKVDTSAERERLQNEAEHLNRFLSGVQKKLSNEGFVQNAPSQVVEIERKKQADAEMKLKVIQENLAKL